MSADPSASIWEVTRMILDSPGTSPSVIAHAHGFSAVEVAELLPIFLDNLRADFSSADGPAPALVPPAQQPGETPEEHADRYLRELAQNEHLDVVGYDTLGTTELDDLDGGDLDDDPSFLDGVPEEAPAAEIIELDGGAAGAAPVEEPGPDLPDTDPAQDLTEDDPFAASAPGDPGADAVYDDGGPEDDSSLADGADDPGGPLAIG